MSYDFYNILIHLFENIILYAYMIGESDKFRESLKTWNKLTDDDSGYIEFDR